MMLAFSQFSNPFIIMNNNMRIKYDLFGFSESITWIFIGCLAFYFGMRAFWPLRRTTLFLSKHSVEVEHSPSRQTHTYTSVYIVHILSETVDMSN